MNAFVIQKKVRGPWRRYLDLLAPERPALHRYCCKLTGNLWDGEDLMQDTLMRVFSLLGKIDAQLENPQAYLIRTATNLWIDRARRSARERELLALTAEEDRASDDVATQAQAHEATRELLQRLHPQERAALVLKDVFDYSLEETASVLKTTVGAVKSALHRGRARIDAKLPSAGFETPERSIVQTFMQALASKDIAAMERLCTADLTLEMVGGAESQSFEQGKTFFTHAHMTMPALGFGLHPRWELIEFDGEPMVLGFRTLNGREGVNEVHRIETLDGRITRIRAYCFCPETLRSLSDRLGLQVVVRDLGHRSPSYADVPRLLLRHVFKRSRSD